MKEASPKAEAPVVSLIPKLSKKTLANRKSRLNPYLKDGLDQHGQPLPQGAKALKLTVNGRKNGRPTKYRPRFNEDIIAFFSTPYTFMKETSHCNKKGNTWVSTEEKASPLPTMVGFAAMLGVDAAKLRDWGQRFPKFRQAFTRARQLYEARVADLAARGFLNPAFSIFLAKNTMNWSDKQEITHSGGMQHDHFFEGMLKRAEQIDLEEKQTLTAIPTKELSNEGKGKPEAEGEAFS